MRVRCECEYFTQSTLTLIHKIFLAKYVFLLSLALFSTHTHINIFTYVTPVFNDSHLHSFVYSRIITRDRYCSIQPVTLIRPRAIKTGHKNSFKMRIYRYRENKANFHCRLTVPLYSVVV